VSFATDRSANSDTDRSSVAAADTDPQPLTPVTTDPSDIIADRQWHDYRDPATTYQ
jgi:hypothetical protein